MNEQAILQDNCLPLASAFNLRDFGGHVSAGGRRVRSGMLYRSGTMAMLTPDDADRLRTFGIRAICDFRRPSERTKEPTGWHGAEVDYFCRDYSGSSGVLSEMLRQSTPTATDMRDAMIALYRTLHIDHAEAYRAMFGQLLAGRLPLLINCSAGKDRTGAGAALVLAALNVSRAAIVEDYLATNRHADWDWLFAQGETALSRSRQALPDSIAPVLRAETIYIETLFDTIDAEHGDMDTYLASVLGVDAAARRALCEALLES